jgi:5-methylcytosine-specific restriction endonuclease McrA
LKKNNIERRSLSDANTIKWTDERRKVQSDIRKGKPSATLGKTWKLNHIKKSLNITGENNPNWKGGKTKLSSKIRNSAEYSFWRMSVFRRDNWTCQTCGAKNKKGEKYIFDADHIYPFSKILDDFNIASIEEAVSCEKLWDIENGRTLCRECHKKTETWGVNLNKNA